MSKSNWGDGSNAMWERSRFIVPELKEAILDYEKRSKHRIKPSLDEQEIQDIEWQLRESLQRKSIISVVVFQPVSDETLIGFVTQLSVQQVRMATINGHKAVSFHDIMRVVTD